MNGRLDAPNDGDQIIGNLDRINKALDALKRTWEHIPIPSPYRGIVMSWATLETIVLSVVSSAIGFSEGIASSWFFVPTASLTALHVFALVTARRSQGGVRRATGPSSLPCRHRGCTAAGKLLGFCHAHAERARSVYRFLDSFSEQDASVFSGRDEAIADLLAATSKHSLTVLVGESGVGKSSLLRAGLNPALSPLSIGYINCRDIVGAPVPFLESWRATAADAKVIELDQFEQVFSRFTDAAGDAIQWIADRIAKGDRVVLSMRRDYIDDLDQYQEVLPDIYRNRIRLLRFTQKQAEDVMRKSAEYASATFHDDLIAAICEDLGASGTDTVPPNIIIPAELQIVCSRLLEGSSEATLDDYRFRGRRLGLLEEFLLDTIERFPVTDRAIAKHVFFELARGSRVSRRIELTALAQHAPRPERVGPVLKRLETQGFVNGYPVLREDGGTETAFELTHEYLIPLIRKFVHEGDVDYYRAKHTLDLMISAYRQDEVVPFRALLWALRHQRSSLTSNEKDAVKRIVRRWLKRRALPLSLAIGGLGPAFAIALIYVRHLHFLAAEPAYATITAPLVAERRLLRADPEEKPQVPIMVYRGHPMFGWANVPVWETGYFLDGLSPSAQSELGKPSRSLGALFEAAMVPLLSSADLRAQILLRTAGEPLAIEFLRGRIEAEPTPSALREIFDAIAGIDTASAAALLLEIYSGKLDLARRLQILSAMSSMSGASAASALNDALKSSAVPLADRLAFIRRLPQRTAVKFVPMLKQLAVSSVPELRGVSQAALVAVGEKGDYRELRSFLQLANAGGEAFTPADNHFGDLAEEVAAAVRLALSTQSTAACVEFAQTVASAVSDQKEGRMVFENRGLDALATGMTRAITRPAVAERLFAAVLAHPDTDQSTALCNVLVDSEGAKHVTHAVLNNLAKLAPHPHAMRLLRFVADSDLSHDCGKLAAQLKAKGVPVDAQVHIALALVRCGEPEGMQTLRDLLATVATMPDEARLFRQAIGETVAANPSAYLRLASLLVGAGEEYLLTRAALGDRAVVRQLQRALEDETRFDVGSLEPIEGDELLAVLRDAARSEKESVRSNTLTAVASLRGRQRMAILTLLPESFPSPLLREKRAKWRFRPRKLQLRLDSRSSLAGSALT